MSHQFLNRSWTLGVHFIFHVTIKERCGKVLNHNKSLVHIYILIIIINSRLNIKTVFGTVLGDDKHDEIILQIIDQKRGMSTCVTEGEGRM